MSLFTFSIAHFWYIKVLAWLRDFPTRLLYWSCFRCIKSLMGITGQRNLRKCASLVGAMLEFWYIERGQFFSRSRDVKEWMTCKTGPEKFHTDNVLYRASLIGCCSRVHKLQFCLIFLYFYFILFFYYFLFTGALFTGIYGMWNTYVFAVVFLYAPSRSVPATGK